MLDKRERNALLQDVVNELRKQNETISPAILRKTVYHVAKMGENEIDCDEKLVYSPLLYAEAQAYMDGFAAAVDGDYNIDVIDIHPISLASIEQNEQLLQFGNILPTYMLSRASNYSSIVSQTQPEYVKGAFGNALPTVAVTGFVLGFSQAIKDIEQGMRYKSVYKSKPDEFFNKIASVSVDSVLESGEQMSLKKLLSVSMKELSERKISTKSGSCRFVPDNEEPCLTVYGIGFVQGVVSAWKDVDKTSDNDEIKMSINKLVELELQSWCNINGYPQHIYPKARSSSINMLKEIEESKSNDGMFLLNGWGFADGYASMQIV